MGRVSESRSCLSEVRNALRGTPRAVAIAEDAPPEEPCGLRLSRLRPPLDDLVTVPPQRPTRPRQPRGDGASEPISPRA